MNNILLITLLLFSCLFSQYNISTKQYSIFKPDDLNEIDFSNIISNINGKYSLELISVENPDFKKIKKTLLETCDLKFSLLNKNSSIKISRCGETLSYEGKMIIDDQDYTVSIKSDKYEYLNCNFVFWISGNFISDNQESNNADNGVLREYHENESLYIEYHFINGKKDGIQKRWHENGQLEIIYNYNNGKLEGIQKKWHKNGQLKGEWNYNNDKLHGIIREWYPNKQLKFTKKYNMGTLIEVVNNYNPNGTIIQ